MVNLYSMDKLLEGYATNQRVKRILDNFNIHFIPVINIDGYEFTHTNARLWRKNRKLNSPGIFGVDINRNWPYRWGGQGSSSDPRSDVYHGTGPASEIETKNIIAFANLLAPNIKAAVDFHSYSELLLRPWQWTNGQAPEELKLRALGLKLQNAIRGVHGKVYRNIRGSELYVHSGAMVDFWYQEVKVPSFTIELRPDPSSPYGFILPPQFILPTAQENFGAVIEMCEGALEWN